MNDKTKLTILILNAVALALGIAVTVLCLLTKGTIKDLISMTAISIVCIALAQFIKNFKK